jgi:hypothetical protein
MRLLIALAVAMAAGSVSGRDLDGLYARENPGLHAWFESLQNDEGTPCCDTGDGIGVADVDWTQVAFFLSCRLARRASSAAV